MTRIPERRAEQLERDQTRPATAQALAIRLEHVGLDLERSIEGYRTVTLRRLAVAEAEQRGGRRRRWSR